MEINHNQYLRMPKGAKTCLLCCHGILGSPRHFDALLASLPENIAIYNMLLDGHGGGVLDFGKSCMRKWESQVGAVVSELSLKFDNIIYLCHSMGSLFGIENSLKENKISKMFLLASPLYPKASMKSVAISLKLMFCKEENLGDMASAKYEVCSVRLTKKLWQYMTWIPRFTELLKKCAQIRKCVLDVKCKSVFVQSACDEVVRNKSSKLIAENPNFKLITLENSSHYLYAKKDQEKICAEFQEFLNF